MDNIKAALLAGLRKFGRKKTFNEILTEAGYTLDENERIELADELESKGMIQSVTYRLPFEIRAELTAIGKDLAGKANSAGTALFNFFLALFDLTTAVFSTA
jgi:hypothetical protein